MTSGTSPALCPAKAPIDVGQALDARPGPQGKPLNYREEIYHPAIADPVVTSGWFEVGKNGSLIRHQLKPVAEVTRIGENFIFQRRESEGGENSIFPIPSELAPLLSSLRSIVQQTSKKTLISYPHTLEANRSGWRLSVQTDGSGARKNVIVLEGCGDVLNSVELQILNRERRRIIFAPAS